MKYNVRSLTKMALVAALYVVLSIALGNLSYGPIQFRVAEVLALLVLIDKKYIYAVTLGCAIANFNSTLGPIDIIVGTLSTFLALESIYYLTRKVHSLVVKLCIAVLILVLFMVPISIELYYILHVPFWLTLLQTMIGEFVVTTIGAIGFYAFFNKRMK